VLRHGVECARIATRLFDLTVSIHGLGGREREWLEHAALLHDVGYSINYRGHHKHGYYLIINAGLDAFDPTEVEIIALLARYHRGKRPTKNRADLAALPKWQRRAVEKLAALLRLGDSFDRTHASRVQELFCAIRKKKKRCEIEVISPYDVDLELDAARSCAPLFRRTFGYKLKIRQGLGEAR
jgi:exopolyphosphatase/guanosine-5'-triphosphate,3'-diphosphate pyrophosphatase